MVLLGVVGNDVVDAGDSFEIAFEDGKHVGLDRVDQDGLVPAADQIGIIARSVGQGDEGVEEPSVEIRHADVHEHRE